MPVSQVITFSATPPTTGETPTIFNYNAIACWVDLKDNIVPDLNTAFTQMNDLETNVNDKEASATLSASIAMTASDLALANSNFKGVWNSASSYAVPSSTYLNGEYFIALSPSSNQTPNPLAATAYWAPYSIAFQITNAETKATPVDADVFWFLDSAASMILKKLTWANIKATMKAYTDTLYVALVGAQAIAGVKTFSSNPLSSAVQDTAATALTRKDYVDTKAPLSSPALTDIPTAPTAVAGTNTTQIATTAFTKAEIVATVSGANVSLATNGYQKLPSGLIIQWGTGASGANNTSATITLPLAFPNAVLSITATPFATGVDTSDAMIIIGSIGLSSFLANYNTSGTALGFKWMAIGY